MILDILGSETLDLDWTFLNVLWKVCSGCEICTNQSCRSHIRLDIVQHKWMLQCCSPHRHQFTSSFIIACFRIRICDLSSLRNNFWSWICYSVVCDWHVLLVLCITTKNKHIQIKSNQTSRQMSYKVTGVWSEIATAQCLCVEVTSSYGWNPSHSA